jgi:hypothetical protein
MMLTDKPWRQLAIIGAACAAGWAAWALLGEKVAYRLARRIVDRAERTYAEEEEPWPG